MFVPVRPISRYFDNMAVYRKVGPRLRAHVRLSQLMGQERLHRFADYIERNLGALAGNFILGLCWAVWVPSVSFLACL